MLTTGDVRCWGSGGNGRLGYGNTTNIGNDETPATTGNITLGAKATAIAAGDSHTCALLTTGGVRCWGYGYYGQLGYGNTNTIGDDETPATAGNVNLDPKPPRRSRQQAGSPSTPTTAATATPPTPGTSPAPSSRPTRPQPTSAAATSPSECATSTTPSPPPPRTHHHLPLHHPPQDHQAPTPPRPARRLRNHPHRRVTLHTTLTWPGNHYLTPTTHHLTLYAR
ncbi:MAG: RCC1 domain-containing protein [Nocardioidaceae bacterium]